jgi:hypothetical protein
MQCLLLGKHLILFAIQGDEVSARLRSPFLKDDVGEFDERFDRVEV